MKEKQSLSNKKSKKPLIIAIVSVLILSVAGVLVYYFILKKPQEKVIVPDASFLAEVESWEKQGSPSVIWVFRPDGTGEITTNKNNYYDMTWTLKGNVLSVNTKWFYELNDSFDFNLDRENKSFSVKNHSDEKESVFLPLGSQAEETAPESVSPAEN